MPKISAIIPARNEAENIEAAVTSLAAQPEVAEIIVVNDHSTDRTAQVLSSLAKSQQKLKTIEACELPKGWMGKPHAAWLGAQSARFEWLLFSDADTVHLPGSAQRALADSTANNAALVSYSPEQITESLAERALIPFIYCRLARRFEFARVNDVSSPVAAANGQFLLVRRDAYDAVGGHRAVAEAVLEDVQLAGRVKQAGFRLYFAPGEGIARTRMYRSFPAMWQGWTKNLYLLLGGTRGEMARELSSAIPWVSLIFLLAGFLSAGLPRWILLAAGFVTLGIHHILYGRDLLRNRYSARLIVYYVPAFLLYAAAVLASGWDYWRGRVIWKGRKYLVRTP